MTDPTNTAMTCMPREQEDAAPETLLYVITVVAVLLGLWGRFKGLGAWPLHTDEYYVARSVENILRSGLPAYPCGGFYTRGILFQYTVALLQMFGMSAELSARFIAAAASVIALPAVYLLGRRLHGRTVGLIAVSVMALSVWEVDIARFGRMYAPFQAIFAWYLVFFLRYTIDREARALGPMLIMTIIGFLTWEGGVFLALANLLPPFIRSPEGRLTAADIRYLIVAAILIVPAYAFNTADFRTSGTDPWPPGYDPGAAWSTADRSYDVAHWIASHPAWLAACLAIVALAIAGLRWPWSIRRRWPAALGLAAALLSALLHQFAAVILILVTLLLAHMVRWREFLSRDARLFTMTVIACAFGWMALALLNPDWLASVQVPWDNPSRLLHAAYQLLRFPDFIGVIALPWARSAPTLGLVLLAFLAFAALHVIATEPRSAADEQVLMVVLVCMVALSSLSNPPRFETRYVFFLYPVAVVIAVATVMRIVHARLPNVRHAGVATLAIVAAGSVAAGDLQPRRMLNIDSAAVALGIGLRHGDKSNLLNRSDPRGAAHWLAINVRSPDAVVVNAYPGVDFYYRDFDLAYIDSQSRRYGGYSCSRGSVERWGNLPLVSSIDELNLRIAGKDDIFIVADTNQVETLVSGLTGSSPRIVWTSVDATISILAIHSAPRLN